MSGLYSLFVLLTMTNLPSVSLCTFLECDSTFSFLGKVLEATPALKLGARFLVKGFFVSA